MMWGAVTAMGDSQGTAERCRRLQIEPKDDNRNEVLDDSI